LPGKKEVKVQSGHLEVKLDCTTPQPNGHGSPPYAGDSPGTGLLDATQLKALNPTTFICASCSLPLVQSSRLSRYNDLPSEHWAELLEAWMCHSDQKLTDRVAVYANGLWPTPGQALVGGSYVLFESSSLVMSNIRVSDRSKVSFTRFSNMSFSFVPGLYVSFLSPPLPGPEEGLHWVFLPVVVVLPCGCLCASGSEPMQVLNGSALGISTLGERRQALLLADTQRPRLNLFSLNNPHVQRSMLWELPMRIHTSLPFVSFCSLVCVQQRS
jgi:hypothetical protein